ncbi:MAG TPA: response regulator [Thermoanaerobaculia bacterium]|nr:response regulator [Thermoanaerobaculia bacterium]
MPPSVLIVDDDPAIVHALRNELEAVDVEVEAAGDATTACALIDEHRFCGLVLDVVLAGSNGFDVLRHMDRTNTNLPTVVITQKLPTYVREMLDERQVKLVFPKPIEMRVLAAVVMGLCGMES